MTMFVRVKFSTYEGCPICLVSSAWLKRTHLQQTEEVDTKRWTPSNGCSGKEKAHPQWMATPQHVHLRGRDNEQYCFSIHNVPCTTTDSHVQWLVQTAYGPREPRGWGGMVVGGIYKAYCIFVKDANRLTCNRVINHLILVN
jgi:hypothetical protein